LGDWWALLSIFGHFCIFWHFLSNFWTLLAFLAFLSNFWALLHCLAFFEQFLGTFGRVSQKTVPVTLAGTLEKNLLFQFGAAADARRPNLEQCCQIFLDTTYQNWGKYTKFPQHYQMAITCTKWP
jgi:hypothetical protein